MEEDIKVLEELLNYDFNQLSKEEYQAIENLITRNKKLEKCLDEDLGNIINLGILLSEHAEKPKDKNIYVDEAQVFLNTLDYYYIPKSKVREKIKQLEKENNNHTYTDSKEENEDMIELLKELLQEGDK